MSIIFYNAAATVQKAEVTSAISTRLHQSLNGECTLDVTMPGKRLPGIIPGDYVRMDNLYFTVTRVQRSSQPAGALFSVSCEHISYLLNDITMPEGTYSGSVSSVLGQILAGTPLIVGSVDVTGSFEIIVGANTNRRDVLQQWATITGAEISYTYNMVHFLTHVGSETPVLLSEAENVVSLTIQMESQASSVNYSAELSRLQTLSLGDEVHIKYSSLEVNTITRVISLDYDYFHPWNISMQCGAYVPTYYEKVNDDFDDYEETLEETLEETKEEIIDEVTEDIVPTAVEMAFEKVKELDFSGWSAGYFSETLDSDQVNGFLVDFDGNGMPIRITDGAGHETEVIW